MKKILFVLTLCSLVGSSAFATIKITVMGSGGLESDGTKHKVCPNQPQSNSCAKIDLPSSTASGTVTTDVGMPTEQTYDIIELEAMPPVELIEGENTVGGDLIQFILLGPVE
ncbi:MAG: hypothetical protein KDC07_06380 [Chitinophagaceae bacterium]|nr:hypothetical protein [Chitinophagaceae bacterium]MCB9045202.1 hypothetical protein [Chitinophagales bacterium]